MGAINHALYAKPMVNLHADKLLIWDFDGTLAYREGGWSGTLLEILQQETVDCTFTRDELRPHLRSGFPWDDSAQVYPATRSATQWWDALDELFARAYIALGIEAQRAHRLARVVRDTYPNLANWRLFDDTLSTLQAFSAQGWTQVILSNHAPELRTIITQLQLGPYFAEIFNSAETGYEKPHLQAFRNVLTAFGNPRTVWMVGDNINADIMGAHAAGIPAILVRRHHEEAKHYCDTLDQLHAIVNSS